MTEPLVAVIVPARNASTNLGRFADALDRQTLSADRFELIVVDDASEDDTAELADRHGVKTIQLDSHGGPYVARNTGATASTAPILAFTDIDCIPAPDWIERGVAAFSKNGTGVLAGEIHVPLGERPSLTTLLDLMSFVNQRLSVERGFALGGNVWVRRSIFDDLGGFNDALMSGGDQEFTRRAVAAGASLEYAGDVLVTHEPYRRGRDLARKARRIGFGAAQHRVRANGPLRERGLMCNRPHHYLPRRRLHGVERIDALGYRLTRTRRLALLAWRYLFLQLPMVFGNLEGAIAFRRQGRAQK